jgi:hypothetical protein
MSGFLLGIGFTIIYLGGAWTFWKGFNRTFYNRSLGNRLKFSLLWPGFFLISGSFRQNFQRALRGD